MITDKYNAVGKVGELIQKMNEDPKFRDLLVKGDLEAKKVAIREVGLNPEDLFEIGNELNEHFGKSQVAIWVPTEPTGFVDKINPVR
jgi:hypothetical protein